MARRTHSPAAKVFTLVLTIAFGLIALAVSYAAFKGGLELRSKAAPETTVKAWEFQKDLEGWTATPYAGRMYVDSGHMVFGVTSNTNPSVINHANLSDEFPQPHQMGLAMNFAVFPLAAEFLPSPTPTTSPTPTPVAIEAPVLGVQAAPIVCAQVITYARSTTGECKAFATPCDVPSGWTPDTSCTISTTPSGSPLPPPFVPFSFSLQLSYRLRGKSTLEKPLSQSFTVTSGKGQIFIATFALPLLKDPIDEVQIAFSQARVGSRIEVDWIHLTAPISTPTPTIVCKTGVNSFSVNTPCSGGYRTMTFSCYDGYGRTEGGPTSCKSSAVWSSYAKQYCEGHSNCPRTSIKPVPTSSPTPTPNRRGPEPTPKPKKYDWCKIMRLLPGGKSSAEYKKNCG